MQGLLSYSLKKMKAKRFKKTHGDDCFQCDEGTCTNNVFDLTALALAEHSNLSFDPSPCYFF